MNIKKLNPSGAFKKEKGKRDLGEKFNSKFYPNNYKENILYLNYEDLLDNLYVEKKGIDYKLGSSKNYNNMENVDKYYNKENDKENDKLNDNKKDNNFLDNYNNNDENNIKLNKIRNNEKEVEMNRDNNQLESIQDFNNNMDIYDFQNNNKNILRGRPNTLKSNKEFLNNKDAVKENDNLFSNEYLYNENNISNNNEENNNICENIEVDNKNEFLEKNNLKDMNLFNDYKKDSINNKDCMNESEDIRLNFVMRKLGLDSLIYIFKKYHMSFNDVLFLTKEDLNELGLKIFQKNRLLSFIDEYSSKAKYYSLEEIQVFFEENNIYNISNDQ